MENKKLITIVKSLAQAEIKTRLDLVKLKKQLANQQKINSPLSSDLLRIYNSLLSKKIIKPNKNLQRLLCKREIRTLSGVAVITVLTKPYPCPGKCIYCPSQKGMPKSYLKNEPAAARAFLTKFDPFVQTKVRLDALKINGHKTDKIELIVLGGSWSAYPKSYQTWFIKRCFDALNSKTAKDLPRAQKINETASHRCVGLTLETRPDLITPSEIKRMRDLGCTRVELGVQTIYDPILKLNKRGQTVKQTILATKLLKQAGFKIMYHLMPNLPGSNPTKDLQMFKTIFSDSKFQPDLLKIYPCVVTKDSILYRWHQQGKFKPYSDQQLKSLLLKIKKLVPKYVRITRLIRDIPAESIIAGNKITNLRQLITDEFKGCQCIRCREAGHQVEGLNLKIKKAKLFIKKYQASGGMEYFLSYESPDQKILFAFLRLRLPTDSKPDQNSQKLYQLFTELKNAAIIRELHTFGQIAPLGQTGKVQHLGFGKKLLAKAEMIAKQQNFKKIAVISGIGVRQYYQKLDYKTEGTYLTKTF
ncbi:MAG: tRNA uridine(34) 5-carboxymethylaminomethyl modification radical SAM/GNAT enzyme Elp3 [Candidatus Buchananbacteria bacterium]